MHPGDTLRLHASFDLHSLWLRQQARDRLASAWAYEREGPIRWTVRIFRRSCVSQPDLGATRVTASATAPSGRTPRSASSRTGARACWT
ncbi:MAG: sulfurtransferase TusA family protein [Mycobacteriales bacterium]